MSTPADSKLLAWDETSGQRTLTVRGDWTLDNYVALGEQIACLRPEVGDSTAAQGNIDLTGLGALDTSGASRLYELLGGELVGKVSTSGSGLSAERRALLQTVAKAMEAAEQPARRRARGALIELFGRAGLALEAFWRELHTLLGFVGFTLEALGQSLFRPRRWRLTSVVAQIETTGLDAVPIICLLNFLVGAVIVFLGATVLAEFGATIYTVNLVTFAFLRELAVLLTAILMAGRTASTFTAELGSMKINEEIDAMEVLGLSPVNLLVLPRVLALLVSLPILTFLAMIAGILGGALVCALQLNISPAMFVSIFHDQIELRHFFVGMSKAPVFAFVIAVIGCLEGMKVSGSALSVGRHTTASVVHSIFVVILLDSVAALFFMEMGW
ncbi:phospholipid/cholesterol/gamma-HCH transport system permease protein [Nitrosospira sp. Nsp14]|uniref:MlaE family ABC transporter permease n=1 Tax=Nitrosospira sp. Nsp14 TaxID=1855333 RepID=UPI0008EC9978|nr:ABC transporter permease [Nitrosospira sp. Nsp14]SFH44046.1 phospholipid/cholesterol/gamma-HCH transport system permease protein [Nitrosospira sp. Nsp14]